VCFAEVFVKFWGFQPNREADENALRAFLTYFGSILYFTYLKSIFSIIQTHFYITPHIPFFTLQNILLK
jgi:hypothetical protein